MPIVSGCSGNRPLGSQYRAARGIWLLLATGCTLWSGAAVAGDSLRCGSYLVSVGDPGYEVEARCGQPSDRYFTADGDIWIYNFGPSRFLEQLRFLNGRLVDISAHGYGFNAPPQGQSPPSQPPPPYEYFSPFPTPYQYEGPLYPLYIPFRHPQQGNKRREYRERLHHKKDEKEGVPQNQGASRRTASPIGP